MRTQNHIVLNLIAAIVFGTGAGISVGFWFSADVFIILFIAGLIGLFAGLAYLTIILFST